LLLAYFILQQHLCSVNSTSIIYKQKDEGWPKALAKLKEICEAADKMAN
jgi:hypothetical protein